MFALGSAHVRNVPSSPTLVSFSAKPSSFPNNQVQGPCQAQPVFLSHAASCMPVLAVALVILFHSRLFTAEICAIACEMFTCLVKLQPTSC